MDRENVGSSDLCSVGYDEEELILEIEFNSGGVYQYFDVPESVYNALMSASSKGEFFHQNIRNLYNCNRLR